MNTGPGMRASLRRGCGWAAHLQRGVAEGRVGDAALRAAAERLTAGRRWRERRFGTGQRRGDGRSDCSAGSGSGGGRRSGGGCHANVAFGLRAVGRGRRHDGRNNSLGGLDAKCRCQHCAAVSSACPDDRESTQNWTATHDGLSR
jgi:hypothetical protein